MNHFGNAGNSSLTSAQLRSNSYFGAAAAAAEQELNSYFSSLEEKERDNEVLVDIAQFLAIGGYNPFSISRDAVRAFMADQPDAHKPGTVVDAFGLENFKYARSLDQNLVSVVKEGMAITPLLEYRKPYTKRRRQIQIVGELFTNERGKLAYPIATRDIDVVTGSATDWESMNRAGGIWGNSSMIIDTAPDGTQGFFIVKKSGNVPVLLGRTDLMDSFISDVHATGAIAEYHEVLNSNADVRKDSVRFSVRGQLVFYTAFKALQGQRAATETASAVDDVTPVTVEV